jgi:hypothetical protein
MRTNQSAGWKGIARRGGPTGLFFTVAATLGVATLTFIGIGLTTTHALNSANLALQPSSIPGDYVTYSCPNSEILIGGAEVCHDQNSVVVDSCDSTACDTTAKDIPDSGYSWGAWTVSGDAYICNSSYSSCSNSVCNDVNPVYFAMYVPNQGGTYDGDLDTGVN